MSADRSGIRHGVSHGPPAWNPTTRPPSAAASNPERPPAARPDAGPRRAAVRRGEPVPLRIDRLELELIDAGELKDRRPVNRRRRGRRLGTLGRDRFQKQQVTLMVEPGVDHPRSNRRRIAAVDNAGNEQVRMKRVADERFVAAPVPERERRGPLRQQTCPLRRRVVRLRVVDELAVPVESVRLRRGDACRNRSAPALRALSAPALPARARDESHRRDRSAAPERTSRCKAGGDCEQRRQRHRPAQSCALSGGSHDFRRRRLAGSQRGGQRIAARQRRRHRQG